MLFRNFAYGVPGVDLARNCNSLGDIARKLLVGQTPPLQQLGNPNNHLSYLQLHKKLLTSVQSSHTYFITG